MKTFFHISLLVIAAVLSGCGDSGPKVITSPTSQDLQSALDDTPLNFPAYLKITRLEIFPSLTGNEVKIEILGGVKERDAVLAIFSASKDSLLPLEIKVPSKLNKEYPWYFEVNSELQLDGAYKFKIRGVQYYN